MTSAHIAEIYFRGRREAAKKCLQKLKAAKLVSGKRRRPSDPAILSITRTGLIALRAKGVLAEYPPHHLATLEKRGQVSELTLRHELQVMDVKSAFNVAMRDAREYSLAEFCTWPLLNQFEAVRPGYQGAMVIVKPDGLIRIQENKNNGVLTEHTLFLEVDRSSETLDTLVTRAGCYLNYYTSGGFAVRNGADQSNYKQYPFRILMVFRSAERRNNIAEKLLELKPPILTQVWLSTIDEVTNNATGAIWIQPRDYRDALRETSFESVQGIMRWDYRRQTARELFVEQNVKKRVLL